MNDKQRELIETELDACGEIMHNVWYHTRQKEGKHSYAECPNQNDRAPEDYFHPCNNCNENLIPFSELSDKEKELNKLSIGKVLHFLYEKGIIRIKGD